MTTSKIVKKQAEELIKLLDLKYIKDIELLIVYLEQCYWVGRVEQQKIDQKQQKMEKLWEVIPDVNNTYFN